MPDIGQDYGYSPYRLAALLASRAEVAERALRALRGLELKVGFGPTAHEVLASVAGRAMTVTIERNDSNSQRLEEMYRPPAADDVPLPNPLPHPLENADFYVVSQTKFLVLFFATFGAYQMYWFFTNWRRYRDRTGTRLSPFWRAVFSVFFVHRLFGLLAEGGARGAPTAPRLEAKGMATLYVALVIGGWIIDRLGDNLVLDSAATLLGLCAAYPLLAAQHAANAAAGDATGATNSRMNGLNYVFIAFGVVLWPFFILGLATMRAGE